MDKLKKIAGKAERRFFFFLASILTFYSTLQAQQATSAVSALNAAANEIKAYYEPTKKVIWALAAIFGLVGAIKLYAKIQGKDGESSKHGMAFFLAAIALLVCEMFLRSTFFI